MRKNAKQKGLTLNEYQLIENNSKKKIEKIFYIEKDIFDYLKMTYLEPENRK